MIEITDELIKSILIKNCIFTFILIAVFVVIGILLLVWCKYGKFEKLQKRLVKLFGILLIVVSLLCSIYGIRNILSLNNYEIKYVNIIDKQYSCKGEDYTEYYYLYATNEKENFEIRVSEYDYHFVADIGENVYIVTSSSNKVLCHFFEDNTSSHINGDSVYYIDEDIKGRYKKITNIKNNYHKRTDGNVLGYYINY